MNATAAQAQMADSGDAVERARRLRPQIEGAAPRIDRDGRLPPEILAALHDAGLFKLLLPRSAGGAEADPATFVAAVEEVAKADASTAWCMAQASGCSVAAAYVSAEVAREIFGGGRATLAWGPVGPNATAVAVAGGYRVTGTWMYASGSRHAGWLGGHCPLVDSSGKPCLGPDGKPLERTLLFPKSAAAIRDIWQVVGLRGTGSDAYAVSDLFVPANHSFTRELAADRRETGPLYRFTTFQLFGAGFGGVALGIARATLDAFVELAGSKVPMLGGKPLRDNAVVQSQVAWAEARYRSSRALLMQSLERMWATARSGENFTLEQRATLRLAAVYAIHQAKDVVEAAYQMAGGTAIFENQAFERRMRDIHAVTQQVQSQAVNFEIAGQVLMGMPSLSKLI
jgi:alkylation response protein AidB-like acyl-CoA dehydrogenase